MFMYGHALPCLPLRHLIVMCPYIDHLCEPILQTRARQYERLRRAIIVFLRPKLDESSALVSCRQFGALIVFRAKSAASSRLPMRNAKGG